jgi:hypothetical protein
MMKKLLTKKARSFIVSHPPKRFDLELMKHTPDLTRRTLRHAERGLMKSTHNKLTFDLIADATSLWSARLEQPCPAGLKSMIIVDQTVRSGP